MKMSLFLTEYYYIFIWYDSTILAVASSGAAADELFFRRLFRSAWIQRTDCVVLLLLLLLRQASGIKGTLGETGILFCILVRENFIGESVHNTVGTVQYSTTVVIYFTCMRQR